jgi:hypothetical protein
MDARANIFGDLGEPVPSRISPFAGYPEEVDRAVHALARGGFPIESKADLVQKLGGPDAYVPFRDDKVRADVVASFLPASLFPIVSAENLAEKVSEFYHQRVDAPRTQPIDAEELARRAEDFIGRDPRLAQAIGRAFVKVAQTGQ